MGGLQMRCALFDGPRPTLAEVLARAEQLGGLALRSDGRRVEFVDVPDNVVTIGFPDKRTSEIELIDYAGDAPMVMTLLEHALVSLGGTMDPLPRALKLPLTLAAVRRDQRRKRGCLGVGCVVICLVLAAIAAAIAWVAWAALRPLWPW
jgi:hypothetical protein